MGPEGRSSNQVGVWDRPCRSAPEMASWYCPAVGQPAEGRYDRPGQGTLDQSHPDPGTASHRAVLRPASGRPPEDR